MTKKRSAKCGICKRVLDDSSDPTTRNCGGDCLKCMADAGDPQAIEGMRALGFMLTVQEKITRDLYANNVPFVTMRKDPTGYAAWCDGEAAKREEFRRDAATECCVFGHPKEPVLWRLAWDHGHSSGFNEIWIYYQDFAELISPEKKS